MTRPRDPRDPRDPGGRRTLLLVGHDTTPETVLVQGGTLVEWAGDRGLRVVPGVAGGPLPDLDDVDAVAVLGSLQGAWDDTVPWLADEIAYLSEAVRLEVPVLGLCFGGQLLARVLGGTVAPGVRSENGWSTIRSEAPDVIADGPWMEFHSDVFTTPPGARRLASSDLCDQAFRAGPHLGLQFHPEVTPASVETWIDLWAGTEFEARLPELGVTDESLRADTARLAPVSREASRVVFDAFLAGAGLAGTDPAPSPAPTAATAPSPAPTAAPAPARTRR